MEARRQSSMTEDIYHFLQRLQENKAQLMATGSSEFIQLRAYPETQVSSITSGETCRPSIFDSVGSSSSISSVLPGQRLPCEFYWYDDCERTFDLRDVDGWVDHVASHHLDMKLPKKCWCWFCDEIVFRAQTDTQQQRRLCYTERMHHVASHYRQGATINDVRPDFDFLHHLWVNRLIPRISFQRARDFHEAPQPKNGIHPVPEMPKVSRGAVIEVKSRPPASSRRRPGSHAGYRQ